MPAYSVLDLAPVPEGFTPADALANSADLAAHAEAWGYTRYWLAEHHGMTGIASAATAVVIGHVAAHTRTIRVGSGGIMLPNHSPLVIAEQFGTLDALHPGRIDLGLGRAPGTDMATARALRRGPDRSEQFPEEVVELLQHLEPAQEGQSLVAVPGAGSRVPVYMLGSSLFGAQLAAHLGLPYAFASHFAPDALSDAAEIYRARFRPGVTDRPHFMLAVNVVAAADSAEAQVLRTSALQHFVNLRGGTPGLLPRPVADIDAVNDPRLLASARHMLRISAVGDPAEVEAQLRQLIARYRPDELILTGQIHDHRARLTSFRLAAEAMGRINAEAGAEAGPETGAESGTASPA